MRRTAALTLLLVALSGCAKLQAIFKPPPPAPERPTPATTAPPPPAARPVPPPPPLMPQMSAEEERRFMEDAQRKIGEADRALQQLEGRQLKPQEQETFLTARTFLEQARKALTAREYQRAANLASKARALTDDLAGSTPR